jgi:hypothetical protein
MNPEDYAYQGRTPEANEQARLTGKAMKEASKQVNSPNFKPQASGRDEAAPSEEQQISTQDATPSQVLENFVNPAQTEDAAPGEYTYQQAGPPGMTVRDIAEKNRQYWEQPGGEVKKNL